MKLAKPIILETAFGEYTLSEQIGEGGSGRVYGGTDDASAAVAIKVLTQTSTDKRRRFKNEIKFLASNRHPNIVTVVDSGIANSGSVKGPFYVMPRYSGNLRDLMKIRIASADVMKFYTQMLDGVEAAHLQKVTHRDLKPENFLQNHGLSLSVADFGIAQFTAHELISLVETDPRQRLANFVYAAPEQRSAGRPVTLAADIYSMGLLLNEMFTGTVPHGVDYQTIGAVSPQYSYLDSVVAQMLKQNPDERPATLAHVKALLEKYGTQFIAQQKLDALNSTVIKATDIDNPLASEPPILIDAQWNDGVLRLKLDRDVDKDWIDALNNMGGHSYDIYAPVRSFQFSGPNASVQVPPESAQSVIDHFKRWLPIATAALRNRLNQQIRDQLQKRQQRLEAERKAEELRIQVNSRLRV